MHVQQLKHARQPIPQHVAVLLFNTRRKEEKRKAKRLANRKSATISRARKKAFIEDMMKDNARLRKRETILKFLPDLVSALIWSETLTCLLNLLAHHALIVTSGYCNQYGRRHYLLRRPSRKDAATQDQ
jgi:hypothetical protein